MVSPDQWRAFLRAAPGVCPARSQSKAFVAGEALAVLPLQFNSKSNGEEQGKFEEWDALDYPPPVNWAAKLPPRAAVCPIDLDVDLKPLEGETAWTDGLEHEAGQLARIVIETILRIGELDGRHRWGRASQSGWGHVYIPVLIGEKANVTRLLNLTMRRPLTIGRFKLRIEVRVGPDPKVPTKKSFTLPGSIYPSRTVRGGYDPIMWQQSPPFNALPKAFPALAPEPIGKLIKGLFAGLLAAVLQPHWGEGARHETALLTSGVLAREAFDETALLDEDDARSTMTALCDAFDDHEAPDRLRTLEATFAALRSNRPVTGYKRLADELIGEEARVALLRLRGGADPDAYAALLDSIAYVLSAGGKENAFLDLSTGGHGSIVCDRNAIVNHFHPHPHYPPASAGRKQIPLIELALNSRLLPRYHAAVNLPGVPFKTVLLKNGHAYREATEAENADLTLPRLLNIGPGFATGIPETPDKSAWAEWFRLWHRHIDPVCNYAQRAIDKVNKAIAWAIQHPLEKVPLGLCFSGGGGIGKSVIFSQLLPRIIGRQFIATANVLNLESQFRLADLEGKKFYCVEEVNLTQATVSIKELLKQLMKEDRMRVNRKYGTEGDVDNFAVPVFLTNEPNPGIVIRGQPERSLVLIQGNTRENTGFDVVEWQDHVNQIGDNVKEFLDALDNPAVREAAMYFFATIEVERRDFEDNSDLGATADPRDVLDPLDEALCAIFEANELHPRFRGEVPLTIPFKMEWLLAGIEHQLKTRNAWRGRLTAHGIAKRLRVILGEDAFLEYPFKDANGKTRKVRYFGIKYGDIIRRASKTLGVALEPAYHPEEEDYGTNTPTPDDCRRIWEMPFSTGPTSY